MSTYQVEELVPHSGRMSLLTRILQIKENGLIAQVDINENSTFYEAPGVPAWVGIEYLAQAIGAYAGYQERVLGGEPKLGFLLGTRKYQCNCEYFALGSTLTLEVVCNIQAENGLSAFDCTLSGNDISAEARLNVFQPDNAAEFLQDNHHE